MNSNSRGIARRAMQMQDDGRSPVQDGPVSPRWATPRADTRRVLTVLWIATVWVLVAVLGAWVWSRLRQREEEPTSGVRRFLDELQAAVDAHPDARWRGLIPGRFAAVVSVDDQDTPIGLHVLFREYEGARRRSGLNGPLCLEPLIGHLVAEVREEGLEGPLDHPFVEVAGDLLPQVRSGAWLREHGGTFGLSGLVTKPLPGDTDLHVCYVIDRPMSMTFVCRDHLRIWRCTDEAVHQLAMQNLRSLGALPEPDDPAWLSRKCDGYDAARVLLLDDEAFDGAVVALPERDMLWLGRVDDSQVSKLSAINERHADRARNPISPSLFRLGPNGIRVVPTE